MLAIFASGIITLSMKKKPLIVLAIVIVVSIAAWFAWRANRHDQNKALTLYGNVDVRQISLSFEGTGRVKEMRAEEGDSVKAGTVLAVLDTRTLTLQAEQAQAQVDVQKQTLQRLQNGARPQEMAQARSRVAAAQADASRAEQDLARLQEISANTQGRAVSALELDRAKAALKVATANLDEQRQALRLLESGTRTEEVAGAAAQLKAAQAQLALLQHDIAQGELKAPSDAVVRSRLLEPGDMATPQRPVFALALAKPKWVRAYVSETDLGKIRPGMAARVVTDSDPAHPINGSIGYISSVAEFTPKPVQTEELRTSLVYEVRIVVDDRANVLRLGQPATIYPAVGTLQ
jgi:HlyD family secretion protein